MVNVLGIIRKLWRLARNARRKDRAYNHWKSCDISSDKDTSVVVADLGKYGMIESLNWEPMTQEEMDRYYRRKLDNAFNFGYIRAVKDNCERRRHVGIFPFVTIHRVKEKARHAGGHTRQGGPE